jgi:hypothetical protein
MKKLADLRKFHQELNSAYHDLEMEFPFPDDFYQAFLGGENELYQKSITEIKTFHEDWIKTIESFFPSLNKIIRDPKSGLRYDQEIVAIEKAKKTNSDSIRHLAANTHLIKEMKGTDVIPKRILTTQAEIEYAIYENRFVKTLIDRLFDFVNRRYDLVKKNVDSFNKKHFDLKSQFSIQDSEVDLHINFTVKEDLVDETINQTNNELLSRIMNLLKLINGLKMTPFIQGLKGSTPVKAPIMQTSILLINIDYKNCYTLWMFLDRYHTLDFDVDVQEQNLTFDRYYTKNVYQLALQTFTTVYANQKALEDHYQYLDIKEYRKKNPKIVTRRLEELIESNPSIDMEDVNVNEYYLEQYKKQFKKSLDEHLEDSSSFEVALRKALRETLEISNAIYKSYFNLDDAYSEGSYFQVLVKEDTEDEINKLKEKARVARIIREIKEVDYNNTIRLEKRIMKEIDDLDKQFIKETKRKIQDDAKKAAIEEKIKLERENLKKNQEALSTYLAFVSETKKVMTDEHKETTAMIRETRKQLKAEEKLILKEEKKKAKLLYEEELRKIKEQHKEDQRRLNEKLAKQRQQEEMRLKKQQEKLIKQSEARLKKEKAKITDKAIKKLEEKVDQLK